MNDLKSAFDWCLMNNIRLVNLSFGTTHFKDKSLISQLVNQYVNKGLIIVAATANSGYTAFPASVSSIIGVKAGDIFSIDESLQDRGADFAAPSEHIFRLVGNDIRLQKKQKLYQRLGERCVQYIPDWIEKEPDTQCFFWSRRNREKKCMNVCSFQRD